MKHLLLDLLGRTNPSRYTINNCILLIQREQTANKAEQDWSHDESLLRARNAALETAQHLEAAIQTPRIEARDHAELLGALQQLMTGRNRVTRSELEKLLFHHETARTLRALRKS